MNLGLQQQNVIHLRVTAAPVDIEDIKNLKISVGNDKTFKIVEQLEEGGRLVIRNGGFFK